MAKINLYNHQPFPETIHRWGWNGVTRLILKHFHDEKAEVMLDGMIEHTFNVGRGKKMNFGRFPHMNYKWINMFHNPCTSLGPNGFRWEQNIFSLYGNKHYRAFMENCIGLITFSKSYAEKARNSLSHLDIDLPVGFVHHPSEECEVKFDFENFGRRVIHVGWWLRNFDSFFRLKTNYKKVVLGGPDRYGQDPYFLKNTNLKTRHKQNNIHWENYLSNTGYDKIMSESVVFLDLYDSIANNAVVECISRQTPILVNPIDSVVEYLGKDYPFYYYSLDEAAEKLEDDDLIKETSEYLKSRQRVVSKEKFVTDLDRVLEVFLQKK
jgi:hypothetical protein